MKGKVSQAFKISCLFYTDEIILNLNKPKNFIVQYKITYSLKIANYDYFEYFIKKQGKVFSVYSL